MLHELAFDMHERNLRSKGNSQRSQTREYFPEREDGNEGWGFWLGV